MFQQTQKHLMQLHCNLQIIYILYSLNFVLKNDLSKKHVRLWKEFSPYKLKHDFYYAWASS